MAKEFTLGFYQSVAWKKARLAYMKSVHGLCEECLAKGIVKGASLVHHKTPITPENITDPEITLSWNNLEALCRDCHWAKHEAEHDHAAKVLREKRIERFNRRWRVTDGGHIAPLG